MELEIRAEIGWFGKLEIGWFLGMMGSAYLYGMNQ